MSELAEEWRAIPGYSPYQASDLGRVRSLNRKWAKRGGRVLTPQLGDGGYWHLTLQCGPGRGKTVYVHQVVAWAFHGDCPDEHVVNHKDTIKVNNRADNLEYVTKGYNARHAILTRDPDRRLLWAEWAQGEPEPIRAVGWDQFAAGPEAWRSIPGYSLYQASSRGFVRRVVPEWSKKFGKVMISRRASPKHRHYLTMTRDDGRRHSRYVHHLVAEAFIGPRPVDLVVNHEDGEGTNNAIWNLSYVTHAANTQHAYRLGLTIASHGEAHVHAVLTTRKVAKIKRQLAAGASQGVLAREYGVSRGAISSIKLGKTWKHVAVAA
jgi:hypothetical protein